MVQVEMNNVYINIGANNGGERFEQKNTSTSGKLIKQVYVSCVYAMPVCVSYELWWSWEATNNCVNYCHQFGYWVISLLEKEMYFQHSHKGECVCVSVLILRDIGINLANQQTKITIKSGKSTKAIRARYHEGCWT